MNYLCISATFLDGRFHGRGDHGEPEWPPSPWRLFQAMIAAANGTKQEAFQWFERLPAPEILAPDTRRAKRCRHFVPNNSSDVKQDGSDRTEKVFQPLVLTVDLPVHYLYALEDGVPEEARTVAEAARQVSALGWGIDLVAVNAVIVTSDQTARLRNDYRGRQLSPVAKGGYCRLRAPVPGSFADLVDAHANVQNTFDGLRYTFPRKASVFQEVGYRLDGAVERHSACFRLLALDGDSERSAAFDPRYASHIASWVRGRLCETSRQTHVSGVDPEMYIAGHVEEGVETTPPRFSYLPLPTIGHPHADGLVRRVIVAESYGDDGAKAEWAGRVLDCAQLANQDGKPVAECRLADPSDPVFREYTRPAMSFRSVTPVILPGFDDGKYAKAEKLLLKAFGQAGFPEEQLAGFTLQKAPFFKHGCTINEYRRPKHLQHYSAIHVRLALANPLQGPFVLGAGRHRGLGLFAAEPSP